MGPLDLKGEEINSNVEFPTCGLQYRLTETFECYKQCLLLFSIQNILSFLKLSESTKLLIILKFSNNSLDTGVSNHKGCL